MPRREQHHSRTQQYAGVRSVAILPAIIVALVLVIYPNALALLAARRGWDQWRAFTLGNTVLGLLLLAYGAVAGLLQSVWGHATLWAVFLGLGVGAVPLAVILILIFLPGPLGQDIVASGIGDISTRQFLYRLGVQVAITTVVVEEFAFRGVLQVLLARSVGPAWGVVALDAAIYGLWHALLQVRSFAGQPGAMRWVAPLGGTLVYALLGVLLAGVRQVAGSLLVPLVAHGLLDVLMFAGMFVRRRGTPLPPPSFAQRRG